MSDRGPEVALCRPERCASQRNSRGVRSVTGYLFRFAQPELSFDPTVRFGPRSELSRRMRPPGVRESAQQLPSASDGSL